MYPIWTPKQAGPHSSVSLSTRSLAFKNRCGASICSMMATIAIIGFSTAAVRAADDSSPLVSTLPESARHLKSYLFMLKKNNISLRMSPEEFCRMMDYGTPVLFERPEEIKDDKIVPGKLEWVICRFGEK